MAIADNGKPFPEQARIVIVGGGIMGVGPSKDVILKEIGPSTICAVRLGGMGVALGTSIGKEVASMV